jgi:hypothetical protein
MTPLRRRLLLVGVPVVVVLLVVGFVLFRPDTLFFDDVVDEALDEDVAALLATPPGTVTTSPAPTARPAPTATPAPDPSTPAAAPVSPTPGTTAPEAAATPETTPNPSPAPAPEPAGPVALARGEWVSLEHATTGTVALVDDGGDLQLVLADLDGSNGPDLRVILSPKAAVAGDWFGYEDGAVYLGALKGNQGTQTYDVPDDLDLDDVASVVIWCERFSVGFAAADLV